MSILYRVGLSFAACFFCGVALAKPIACASDATDRAKKFLNFHVGGDDRIEIDSDVKELPSIRNPANDQQKFKVLEVKGFVYKGEYRMRFIYYYSQRSCHLVGEEVLQHVSL